MLSQWEKLVVSRASAIRSDRRWLIGTLRRAKRLVADGKPAPYLKTRSWRRNVGQVLLVSTVRNPAVIVYALCAVCIYVAILGYVAWRHIA